jgi:2',3'-cyclic-nucleotide 2'-phosphodiesterase (5'-nucleotidase family)
MKTIQKILFSIACITIISACKHVYYIEQKNTQYKIEQIDSKTQIEQIIQPYKIQLDSAMNEIIGHCATTLEKEQPEGTLGNFLAEAIKIQAEKEYKTTVDLAIINNGGIRIPSLPKGNITRRIIFELMPFDNVLIIIKTPGDSLIKCFNVMAEKGGWPIAGAKYVINKNKAKNILIQDKPIEKSKIYTLAISDYLANGGDNLTMFNKLETINTGYLQRNAIIDYIIYKQQNNQTISSSMYQNVKYEQ